MSNPNQSPRGQSSRPPGGESSRPEAESSQPGGESSRPEGESSRPPGGESSRPEYSQPGGEYSRPEYSQPGAQYPGPQYPGPQYPGPIAIDSHLLQAAIEALGVTAPVYSAVYLDNGAISITTRDGVHIWSPTADDHGRAFVAPTPRAADDLTVIPQIGTATEDALNQLGIFTYDELARANTDLLLTVMPRRALRTVCAWLKDHGYIPHIPSL